VKVNDASCRMYGYTRDELLGQSVTLIASPEEATATAVGNETGAVSAIATTERAMRSGKTE
jgi:PAS domain S-box-containing protein